MLLSRYYTLVNLVALTVLIYCGVDIFYTLAGSKLTKVKTEGVSTENFRETTTVQRQPFSHYREAINRGLFGTVKEPLDKSRELDVKALEPTALKIALLGTVSGDPQNAAAIIKEINKKTQSLYREGDTIQNATIIKILRGKVILRIGSKNQILTMEEGRTSSRQTRQTRRPGDQLTQPGTTISLDRSMVSKTLQNISELISQVRIRPHFSGGKADGLMLSQIRSNSLFTKMGIRNGDIVQRVNGKMITSPDDIIGFYKELNTGSKVSMEIKRRGKNKIISYTFK
ncbi:MAG: PDZ domain-containing protein [Desulfobacterales bacterium]|nr:PDZ domain-containing protein [Desulfobacterales bacterium]